MTQGSGSQRRYSSNETAQDVELGQPLFGPALASASSSSSTRFHSSSGTACSGSPAAGLGSMADQCSRWPTKTCRPWLVPDPMRLRRHEGDRCPRGGTSSCWDDAAGHEHWFHLSKDSSGGGPVSEDIDRPWLPIRRSAFSFEPSGRRLVQRVPSEGSHQ